MLDLCLDLIEAYGKTNMALLNFLARALKISNGMVNWYSGILRADQTRPMYFGCLNKIKKLEKSKSQAIQKITIRNISKEMNKSKSTS